MQSAWASKQKAFTIVELLIVIVVIAILAAITIVAYTGIQDRAKQAALQSAASQASKKILAYAVENTDLYPPDEATFFSSTNLADTPDTDYTYLTSPDRTHYCLSTTNPNNPALSTAISDTSSGTVEGRCVRNYATNPGIEADANGWNPRKTATISRSSGQQHTGCCSMLVTTPGVANDEGLNMNSLTGSVSSGLTGDHRGSAWVRAASGANLRMFVEDYTSAGTYITGSTSTLVGTGGWARMTAVRNVSAASNRVMVNVRTDGTLATTYYVDDVMITEGSSWYEYGDGSFSGWSWDGAPNASTSFGPAKLQ